MLDNDDSAMRTSLLSVNLIQLISVLLKWEHFSVYRAKAVNSLMNSLLRSVSNAVTQQRRKMLDSSPYIHATVDADASADADVDVIEEGEGGVVVDQVTGVTVAAVAADTDTDTNIDVESRGCVVIEKDDVMKDSAAAHGGHQTAVLDASVAAEPSLLIPFTPSVQPTQHVDHRKEMTSRGLVEELEIDLKEREMEKKREKEVEKEMEKEREKENYPLELLVELSCVIALFSSRSASILIKGNPHSMVRTYAHTATYFYTQMHK